ncbi:type II CRISPR-associated endonuclease Cas1 [Spiroplasma turonicum]|uniref:CRISPR-associated endonuclease Cas1 n=1 Tax=Spiroplasma turonicum TaxID=216946 RepID=A0A0K1P6N3_9MOLU|nr:type II CRISPR-associated endonuclease Cas1 [Spiroplasma turonicum]AKU79869.1 CRISPR-associated protein Cas1 [Spiroplasma turonicum]ALX70885.1 CRISPR-associated protein Cas1 [Spiroplasma turonicum]
MSWKTIIIKDGERVSLFLNNFVVENNNMKYHIPLDDINAILFENYKTTITTRIINKLAEKKILTIICDVDFKPISIIQPIEANHMQLRIINNQLEWNKEDKLYLWTQIVRQKIEAQIDILKLNLKDINKIQLLYNYIEELQFSDVTNREGHAAKVYFKELYGHDFTRDKENHINAALNFGYTILRHAFARTIVSKGLHPSIALFHHNMYNAFALADDLMEPFRPIVDNYVYKNVMNIDYFSRATKLELVNLLNSKITFRDTKIYLTNAIEKYVDLIINYFDTKDISNLFYPIISSVEYYEL